MKTKELLLQHQPVVYKTLHNALTSNKISHCYLFSGEKGTYKKETAFLLAQSLICENKENGFGCEECMSCIRVEGNNYADLIYIDGAKTIKVDEIERLQRQFEKTALEKAGHKIFIINNCENLTTKSANSLLKFIEEPDGSLTGIFITSQLDRVLPTIISRCQTLNFKPLGKQAFYQTAKDLKLDDIDAHFISNMVSTASEIKSLAKDKSYQQAVEIFCEFTHLLLTDKGMSIVYLQKTLTKLSKKSGNDSGTDGKNTLKSVFSIFLDLSLLFVQDYLSDFSIDDETYTNLLTLAKDRSFQYPIYMKAMIEAKDALNKSANVQLLADQLLYTLTEV